MGSAALKKSQPPGQTRIVRSTVQNLLEQVLNIDAQVFGTAEKRLGDLGSRPALIELGTPEREPCAVRRPSEEVPVDLIDEILARRADSGRHHPVLKQLDTRLEVKRGCGPVGRTKESPGVQPTHGGQCLDERITKFGARTPYLDQFLNCRETLRQVIFGWMVNQGVGGVKREKLIQGIWRTDSAVIIRAGGLALRPYISILRQNHSHRQFPFP